ncbi:GSCOCG00008926001-RA-CDS [Cotesia congregata]|nr:GSCOCG00008926001-RA-CDS [Cotesia congregata]
MFMFIKGHQINKMTAMSPSERRLQKELMALIREPPPGVQVDEDLVGQNLTQWIVHMEGAKGTLYEGERFQLQFKFSSNNGHICLSILTDDWSPALSVQSVCLSIVSMLSSCKEKKRPPDNSFYVKTCNKNPKKTKWWYHGKNNLFLIYFILNNLYTYLIFSDDSV